MYITSVKLMSNFVNLEIETLRQRGNLKLTCHKRAESKQMYTTQKQGRNDAHENR